MSMSSSSSSSSKPRILVVEINSVNLPRNKQAANTYVKLWIHPHKLRTKPNPLAQWNDKFVFSVPNELIGKEDLAITFELYTVRKHLPDHLTGSGLCHLNSILAEDTEPNEEPVEEEPSEDEVVCDTDEDSARVHSLEDDRWSDPFEEERQKQRRGEKEKETEEEEAEKQRKAEAKENVSINMYTSEDECVGILRTRMKVWEGFKCMGKAKLRGMTYEEFIARKGDETVRTKQHPVLTTTDKKIKMPWLSFVLGKKNRKKKDSKPTGTSRVGRPNPQPRLAHGLSKRLRSLRIL